MSQTVGQGVFSSDGKFFYFLTHVAEASPSAVSHRTIDKVDTETGEMERVLEADISGRGILVAHGAKLAAISYLGFKEQALECARGHAAGYTIILGAKAKIVKTFGPGDYQVVPTQGDRVIIDLTNGITKEFDPATLQTRRGESVKKNLYTLFIDQNTKRYFAWNPTNTGVLERYQLGTGSLEAKLPLAQGDHLLQQGGLFAIARYTQGKNRIEIEEDADWGHRVTKANITLPARYKVQDAALLVDLASHTALVYRKAKNKYAQKWDQVMIWSLDRDSLVSHRKVKEKYYLAHAALAPDGKKFIIVMQDGTTDLPTQILVFDLAKQQWIKMKTE